MGFRLRGLGLGEYHPLQLKLHPDNPYTDIVKLRS